VDPKQRCRRTTDYFRGECVGFPLSGGFWCVEGRHMCRSGTCLDERCGCSNGPGGVPCLAVPGQSCVDGRCVPRVP
jgi:hypothetical protein